MKQRRSLLGHLDLFIQRSADHLVLDSKNNLDSNPPYCNWWTLQKPQSQHQNWWCRPTSCRQGGTFLEKENKRSHRDPHPTAITQQGRRPWPPRHLRWSAVTWPFPNGRSCDQEGVNTMLNEEVEMTSQATSLLQSRLWKGIYYLISCLCLQFTWKQRCLSESDLSFFLIFSLASLAHDTELPSLETCAHMILKFCVINLGICYKLVKQWFHTS